MSQIINKRIAELKNENYKTKPQNLVRFKNPYLLKSKTEVLNEIYNNNIPLDKPTKIGIISTTNLSDTFNVPHPQMPSEMPPIKPVKIEDDSTEESVKFRVPNSNNEPLIFEFKPEHKYEYTEPDPDFEDFDEFDNIDNMDNLELAMHVQDEVYKPPSERRAMKGFNRIKSLGNDENVVYKSDSKYPRNVVVWGVRGSSVFNDFVVDAQIGMNKYLVNDFTENFIPRKAMMDRFKNTRLKYFQIRKQFPDAQIIMGGHSLGNAVGLDILKVFPDDKKLKMYGFNGYNHHNYNGENDPRYGTVRAEGDIVSIISNNQKSLLNTLKEDPALNYALFKAISGSFIHNLIKYSAKRRGEEKFMVAYENAHNPDYPDGTAIPDDLYEKKVNKFWNSLGIPTEHLSDGVTYTLDNSGHKWEIPHVTTKGENVMRNMGEAPYLRYHLRLASDKLQEMLKLQNQQDSIKSMNPDIFKNKVFINFEKPIEELRKKISTDTERVKAIQKDFQDSKEAIKKIMGGDPNDLYDDLNKKYGSGVPIEAQLKEIFQFAKYVVPRTAGLAFIAYAIYWLKNHSAQKFKPLNPLWRDVQNKVGEEEEETKKKKEIKSKKSKKFQEVFNKNLKDEL